MWLRGSLEDLLGLKNRLDELVETVGEVDPGCGHEAEAIAALVGEGVVLAGVAGVGFDPLGGKEGFVVEAAEEGVDGAFGENEAGLGFEETDDLEAVEAASPEAGEGGHLKGSFAELGFPAVGLVGGRAGAFYRHSNIPCIAMYMVVESDCQVGDAASI